MIPADNHKLFNPDCSLRLLVDSIRRGCLCPEHGMRLTLIQEEMCACSRQTSTATVGIIL